MPGLDRSVEDPPQHTGKKKPIPKVGKGSGILDENGVKVADVPLSTPSPAPAPPAPLLPPPSEHLIRHLRAGSDSVHLPPPRMPDIVPIVRRPVKKLNSPPIFDKRSEPETSQGLGRKFGLPTDKSSGNSGNGSRVKRICEGNLPVKSKALSRKEEEELPVSVSLPKYSASDFVSAQQKRNVVPELRVAEAGQRVAKTTKDLELERKVLQWIMSIVHEEPTTDYDRFIQDGSILSKVMTSIVFNSVELYSIDDNWGMNPALDRVKAVIREIRRYGVVEVFEPEDLIELRNIPAVTKCLAQLSKLAASDKNSLLSTTSSS